jgi:hypothetical protein
MLAGIVAFLFACDLGGPQVVDRIIVNTSLDF